MELSNDAQLVVQQKLNYAVKYSETYDEVYDHVVTAINISPEQNTDAANLTDRVIERDFGGYTALKQTEEERAKLVNKAMRNKHWQHITRFFNIPFIGLTLIVVIAAYFIAADPKRRTALIVISMLSSIAPILFLVYKRIAAKYQQRKYDIYRKPSLKDNYIFIAAILANSLFNLANAANKEIVANGGITMFVFVFYMVYVSSFFKLYHDEFKMNLAH